MFTRRSFLKGIGAAGCATASFNEAGVVSAIEATRYVNGRAPEEVAADEDFWFEVQQAFTVDRTLINLNNGGVSPSPRIVQEAMRRYLEFSNHAPTYTMWRILEPQIEAVRKRLAAAFGCDTEEMAITRNASEALEICQLGLDLKPGDEILTTEQDYPRMLTTWRQRERRDRIVVKKIQFPTPPESLDQLALLFEQAITPRTRVIHFCHITNLTGQIFPVKRICQMARARGIEAIVDGAHAFAHFPFKHADLDCDYYGTSLHKWLLAPIGTGFLYVKKEKQKALWPLMAAAASQDNDIRKYEEIGTHPAANHNAISAALAFHRGIGSDRKIARLRYLRNRWAKRLLAESSRVTVLTPLEGNYSGAIGFVTVDGLQFQKLGGWLMEKHRIVNTPILHAEFNGLRITPNVYTTIDEIDIFSDKMVEANKKGIA